MKKITVVTEWTTNETSICLKDGRTASRRQYVAALKRCHAGEGDYLRKKSREEKDVPVFNGKNLWAIIA